MRDHPNPRRGVTRTGVRLRRVLACLAGLAWLVPGSDVGRAADSSVTREYKLKAAFIYNFTKFVEWPASSFADDTSPLVVGVVGSTSFAEELQSAIQDRKVNQRDIRIRVLTSTNEAPRYHVLFIPASEEAAMPEYLAILESAPVLTIGETEKFARDNGVITFVVVEDKVRFDINAGTAGRAGLKISAQLQKLARTVHP
jgi:hypothetical protein